MVSADRVVAFAAMSFVLIVVPGPSVLFVIGRALAQGRRAVLTTVATVGGVGGLTMIGLGVTVAVTGRKD